MKGPISVPALSAVGASKSIPLDPNMATFNVGLQAVIGGAGTLTYSWEYTLDDIRAAGYSDATANWFPVTGLGSQTASAAGSLTVPATAVRLHCTAWTSGSVSGQVLQSGRPD